MNDLFADSLSPTAAREHHERAEAKRLQRERLIEEAGQAVLANGGELSNADIQRLAVAQAELDNARRHTVEIHSQTPVPVWGWPHVSSKGLPLNTIPNLAALLDNYGIHARYDVIRKDLVITYPGQSGMADNQRTKALDTIISLCALNRLPKSDVPSFLVSIGDDNAVNPVADFITSKPWDGQSRFGALLDTIQTRPGYSRELLALLVRRWLVSAVAAAVKPHGFWSKGVLVFQGAQSLGKTSWIRALLPEQLRDLLKVDATIDPSNKDTVISAVSHWLCELGELDGTLRKADIARLKGFISQDVDQFRRPYGRTEEKFPRRTVFFASVNPDEFLADDTGNVRWWTVPVTGLNVRHGIDLQQLWAEVLTWYQAGERWWLEAGEEQQLEAVNEQHQSADPVGELIQSRYGMAPKTAATRLITATEVLLEIGYDRPSKAQLNAAGSILKRLYGEAKRTKAGRLFSVPFAASPTPF
ncbi:VapE domain-containing protein [uncultured Pseudomonas sp.]|uniref:VapE domain-containing protein n=1 Tax=uncultured Pseudomonas sp. TaxID=114707 RepID=UPI00258F324E|nr:VapE domain-containing protein [uncultured Pseudomonas sp.]